MEQRGIVTALEGKYAVVKIRKKASCSDKCSACEGCGFQPKQARVINEAAAKRGANVLIEIKASRVLDATAMQYVLPVVIGMLIYTASYATTENSVIAQVAGIGLFAVSYLGIFFSNRKKAESDYFAGRVKKIID